MGKDTDRIRREVSLASIVERYGVRLERDGHEFVACCPFHEERTPSFTIFTSKGGHQLFHCFGCDAKGDVLDFVQGIEGIDLPAAIRVLDGSQGQGARIAPRQIEARDPYADLTPIEPPHEIEPGKPVRLYNPKRAGTEREWGAFTPSLIHPYRLGDGTLLGYVLRHDLPDGRKETPMVMWVRWPNGEECWSRFPFPRPRPLYRADAIEGGRMVIVVEGEKCADRLAEVVTYPVVSWAGGTQGVKWADWSALAGRNVVMWPDADKPGRAAADEIGALLDGKVSNYRVIEIEGKPDGWDVADAIAEGWSGAQIAEFMKAQVRPWVKPDAPEPAAPPAATPATARVVSLPVREARTTAQAKPDQATVTKLDTRATYTADEAWMTRLVYTDKGAIKPAASLNWSLFLEHHHDMRGVLAFDAFRRKVMLMRCPPWADAATWEPRPIADRDYSEAVAWLEARHMSPKFSNIGPTIQMVAEHHTFDPLTDYLEGLTWDGVERVETFACTYLGVDDDANGYARTVSRLWLVSSAARALSPGEKVDTMPILEGLQGKRKSAAVQALYGKEFFTDALSSVGSKDAMMEMQGVWGIEVAEMHRFGVAETNHVKQFLASQVDRFRPPYGRSVIEAPRRSVMVGTINPEGSGYLKDATGARRFWPISTGRIDVEGIERDRDQIWAEAVKLFRDGVPWWVQNDELVAVTAEQEKRSDVDPLSERVSEIVRGRHWVTQWDIMVELGFQARDADTRLSQRLGRIMLKLGWTQHRDRKNGQDRTLYRSPGYEPTDSSTW